MGEHVYLCMHCHRLFRQSQSGLPADAVKTTCSNCGKHNYIQLKTDKCNTAENEIGPPAWEFVCYSCWNYFEVPSPKDPDEAKKIRCVVCQGDNIERFNVCSLESMDHTCFG